MGQLRLFKIRDLRQKEKFVIDDIYLNGYAKRMGVTATAVYMSLCRHADKEQQAFPAEKTIAEQHGLKSERTVKRAIKKLRDAHIIAIDNQKRTAHGEWLNNTYILLDKSMWISMGGHQSPSVDGGTKTALTGGHQSPTKETHIKETHTIVPDKPADWNFDKKLEEMEGDAKRHVQIIAIYWKAKKIRFENSEQYQPNLKRELRPAMALVGYKNEDILDTIKTLNNTPYLTKWTMETMGKFINEVVASKKEAGPKILRWEKIVKPDGREVMRAIYEK